MTLSKKINLGGIHYKHSKYQWSFDWRRNRSVIRRTL